MITWEVKKYQDLSLDELHDLVALRIEVFIIEQNCPYQDLDGKDKKALHVIGKIDNTITAYTRIFKPGDYFKEASIGRVVVSKNYRHLNYGHQLMISSIEAVETSFYTTEIKLSAQKYLEKFYNNLGFKTIGESYLEDGIPHIAMIKC